MLVGVVRASARVHVGAVDGRGAPHLVYDCSAVVSSSGEVLCIVSQSAPSLALRPARAAAQRGGAGAGGKWIVSCGCGLPPSRPPRLTQRLGLLDRAQLLSP